MHTLILSLVACSPAADEEPVAPTDTAPAPALSSTGDTAPPPPVDPGTADPLEICINEFMPANTTSLMVDEEFPDWIELHNPGKVPIDLFGYSITDDRDDWRRHVFNVSLEVPAGGFLLLYADAQEGLGPEHLPFSLNQQGEVLALYREDGSGEVLDYGKVIDDLAVVRHTDCGPIDTWIHVAGGTPGSTNE